MVRRRIANASSSELVRLPPNPDQLGAKSLLEQRSAIVSDKVSSELSTPSMMRAALSKWSRSGTAVKSIAAPPNLSLNPGAPRRRAPPPSVVAPVSLVR